MIELVTKNALRRLNELSQTAKSIQAAIAYWAYPPDQLDLSFAKATGGSDGFLCCDLHSPTSVDALTQLKREGSNVFLHLYQLVGKTEVPDSKGIPDHLMHSKVFVFNSGGADCKIWVGSHNATARALTGINFECAVVLSTHIGSDLHRGVMTHLHDIVTKSTPFAPEDIAYYRALQGGLKADFFIELEDRTNSPLVSGSEVTVFGSTISDYQQLTKVGTELYLTISSARPGTESIYRVLIAQSGRLDPKSPRTLTFDPRRFAMKSKTQIPLLERHQIVPQLIYDNAVFFAVLKVAESMPDFAAVELPPERLWEDIPASEYLDGADESPVRRERSPLGRGFKIQRAARIDSNSNMQLEDGRSPDVSFLALSLSARQALHSHSLFRRRLLVRRTDARPLNSDGEDL